jgi:glyceraldehyde 3-phosphate dehydrogenase
MVLVGRLVTRLLMERAGNGEGMRLRAVVVRKGADNDLEKRASLLERDSVHGGFKGTVEVDHEGSAIIANGNRIRFVFSDAPDKIDYTQHGIHNAVICDNTGKWRDELGLGLHLKATGVRKVLLTAPGKGARAWRYAHGQRDPGADAERVDGGAHAEPARRDR